MDFFDQLQIFSERYLNAIHVHEQISPWGFDDFQGNCPVGAILHYTADDDFDRVLRWFMREKYGARASANVVVADRLYASTEELMDGLPLIKELPVTVVQCRPVDMPSWHATWTNDTCYGIELLNVGEVRPGTESDWVSWRRRDHDPDEPLWTMPWAHPLKTPQEGLGRYWEPYTVPQVQAVVSILRHLRGVYPKLNPSWVLGHEAVQGVRTIGARGRDKRDPGPLLPVGDIRRAAFGDDDQEWLASYDAVPDYSHRCITRHVVEWADTEARLSWKEAKAAWDQDNPGKDYPQPEPRGASDAIAWERFEVAVRAMANGGGGTWGLVGKTALRVLGYHVPRLESDIFDEDRVAARIFQKMMGLKPDTIPGPRTRQAIVERLEDRGFFRAVP